MQNGRMSFAAHIVAPARLQTDEFVLRPITAADAALDYAAVMESRDYLRLWEQSTWPADDFTVEADRTDLEKLEGGNADRKAFTYTVLDPAETECLGCVYVFPLDAAFLARSHVTAVADTHWEDYDAAVYFWVRASRLASHLDRALLAALRTWLSQEWNLRAHLFVTNEQFPQQADLLGGTDLTVQFEIAEPGKPGRYLAYAPPRPGSLRTAH